MKLLIAVLLLSVLESSGPGWNDLEARVAQTIDEFHRAAAAADTEAYFGLMTEDAIFIGTDAGERWNVAQFRAYSEPYFSQGKGWTYVASSRSVDLAEGGAVAWFDERLQNETYGEARGSGVLELVDGAWKIAQYNLSLPVPNEHAQTLVNRAGRNERVGEPRGEQLFAMDGERSLAIWNKVVPAQLEKPLAEWPIVVLLPSATFSARASWDFPLRDYSVMNALARRGFDVFAVDVGGYGLSSPPLDVPTGGARSATRDLRIAIDHITELRGAGPVVIVGPSWGSQLAGHFANQHPERVRGLVLYGFSWRQRFPEEAAREIFGEELFESRTRAVTRAAAVGDFIPGFHEEDVPAAFTSHLLSQARSVPTGSVLDYVRELPLVDPARIEVPTLMMYGRLEFERPAAEPGEPSRFAAKHWEDARDFYAELAGQRHWIEIPGAGHSAHLDTPRLLFQRCLAGWIERLETSKPALMRPRVAK